MIKIILYKLLQSYQLSGSPRFACHKRCLYMIILIALNDNDDDHHHHHCCFRGTQRRFPPKCTENTFQPIQNTFRSLEKHSKRHRKLCICSVILGEHEPFRNFTALSTIFPTFSNSSRHHIFESENFRFPFFCEKQPNLGNKMLKLNFRKSQGRYQIGFENCT